MGFAGGVVLALGFMWLLVEGMLRYAAGHGVKIVNWAGPWPRNADEQREINDRLDRTQERELQGFRKLRPIPIALLVAGVVFIVIAAA